MYKHNTLQHVAIIMDGNGRWAKSRNKARREGHKAGANKIIEITQACIALHIPNLTLYAFSTENWNRPKMEINFLMQLLEQYLDTEKYRYIDNQIRFNFIGDISRFHKTLQHKLLHLKEITQHFTTLTQTLAINYGSQDEIARSMLKILHKVNAHQEIDKVNILQEIAKNLDTHPLPAVDMLIRTGGEKRLSNFLLWQSSYAELFFSDTLWPNFSTQELESMVQEFHLRIRKFGAIES